jgi:hypothetical protein
MALPAAIGGIVIMGVLIVGVHFTSSQEYRVGNNTIVQERAFRAAEFGLNTTLAAWNAGAMTVMLPGGTARVVYDSSAAGWVDTVVITRLNVNTYQVVSAATAWGPFGAMARRRTALNVRLSLVQVEEGGGINLRGALTARGQTTLSGNSVQLTGLDVHPTGWAECPPVGASLAGLAAPSAQSLQFQGCPGNACLLGQPPLLTDPDVADTSVYFQLGDETWTSLAAVAGTIITGSPSLNLAPSIGSDGKCNIASVTNWGAPETPGHACRNYFPIIHARGSANTLKLTGGVGQGILLVDGDLNLSGGVTFYGPIIVRGGLTTSGTSRIHGAALVANLPAGSSNSLSGTSLFTYSNCVLHTASRYAIAPRRVVERAWTEVY